MAELEFIIPGKGKPKGVARGRTQTGVHYTPPVTREMLALVKLSAQTALGNRPLLRGALRLTLVTVFPVPSSWPRWKRELAEAGALMPDVKPDMSNILKLIEDGLNEVVFADDKAIVQHTLEKRYGPRPETYVHLRELYSLELLARLEGRAPKASKSAPRKAAA